ncbi:MAG: hypothetical protein HYR94_08850 [Chloroflexi bacterium]|nr:hypothetical protein [Chloroflexota bacterium]
MKIKLLLTILQVMLWGLSLTWVVVATEASPSYASPQLPTQAAYGESASFIGPGEDAFDRGFRAVAIFGETEIPYSSTTTYLNRPYALAVDSADNVFIAEIEGHRVLKFDTNGNFKAQIGYTGLCRPDTGGICRPTGLAVALDGRVWITEEWPERVSIFTYTVSTFSYTDQLGVTWASGSDNAHFHTPEGVAFDSVGRIYVADRRNNRVQIFDNSHAYSTTLGGTCGLGDYQLCQPYGLAIGSGNVLYVADTDNKRVQVYRPVGNSLVFSQSITATGLGRVTGVAIDANYVYAADRFGSLVWVFSRTGAFNSIIDGTNWFSETMDVAVDSHRDVYVADTWGPFRVMKCSGGPSWSCSPFIGAINQPYLTDGGHYFLPNGLAIDANNNIFLTEGGGHRLVKLNSSGVFQFAIGVAGIAGSDTDHFDQPLQVALDSSDGIYVADAGNHRVQIFNSNGNYLATLGFTGTTGVDNSHFNSPSGVAIDTSGNIYVADTDNHRVQIFGNTRNYSATLGTTGISGTGTSHFNFPGGVTVVGRGAWRNALSPGVRG